MAASTLTASTKAAVTKESKRALWAAHETHMEAEALGALDTYTKMLRDTCSAFAYVQPDKASRAEVMEKCRTALQLPAGQPAHQAVAEMVTSLSAAWKELHDDYLSDLDERSTLTVEHVIDITSLVDMKATRAKGFTELEFEWLSPVTAKAKGFSEEYPHVCIADNVELTSVGLLFADADGALVSLPGGSQDVRMSVQALGGRSPRPRASSSRSTSFR